MTKTDVLRSSEGGEEFNGSSGGGSWKDKIEWDKIKKIAVICAAGLFALFLIIYLIILYSPGFSEDSKMTLIHEDDLYKLSWESARGNSYDHYIYTIYEGTDINPQSPASEKNILFSKEYTEENIPHNEDNKLELVFTSQSFKNKNITIYLNTVKHFGFMKRTGSHSMMASVNLSEPDTYDLNVDIDTDSSRILFSSGVGGAKDYMIFLDKKHEDGTPVDGQQNSGLYGSSLAKMAVSGGNMSSEVSFNSDDLSIPNDDEIYTFNMVGEYKNGPLTFYDLNYNTVVLDRENFLTGKVTVYYTNDGNNRFTFTWNETKGDGYDISIRGSANEEWQFLGHVSNKEERRFKTDKLLPCKNYRVRIEAVGTGEEVSEEDRVNETVIKTGPSAQYATIWPVTNLTIYKQSTGEEGIGSAKALMTLTVLDEKDGRFHIKTGLGENAKEGYIDSNYCMINLPDYMGSLCKYDITNAYSSIYSISGYGIPMISGYTIPGYENVLLKDGTFVVPLLYPTAKKLVTAGKKAREEGYVLKITNTYTPKESWDYIYNNVKAVYKYIVPAQKFTKISLKEFRKGKLAPSVQMSDIQKADANLIDTYKNILTNNGEYKVDSLISSKNQMNNFGIAVDLSIVRLKNSKDIKMQCRMHDLSHLSLKKNNNEGANALNGIMTQSGFTASTNKWWMFYDKEARENLQLQAAQSGISVKGWAKDDKGWRYRKSGGGYYTNTSVKIGNKEYTFSEDGYVVE